MMTRKNLFAVFYMLASFTALSSLILLGGCQEAPTTSIASPSAEEAIKRAQAGPHQLATGRVAIKPSLSGTPAFRPEEARAYAESGRIPIGVAHNVHATAVSFITSGEVSKRLDGASTGFPDDTALCFVEMQGEFTFSGPKGSAPRYERAFEVFDAKSGNLLMAGGLPKARTPKDRSSE
jgi:hypothetical protein